MLCSQHVLFAALIAVLSVGKAMLFCYKSEYRYCNLKPSIQAYFSESTSYSTPHLLLEGTLPPLRHFTLCTWAKAWKISFDGSFIFSYDLPQLDNELLVGVYKVSSTYSPPYGDNYGTSYSQVHYELSIHVYNQQSRVICRNFVVGKWQHLCYVWTNVLGHNEMYVDGIRCAESLTKIADNYIIQTGGTAVIGQEQDIIGGGFDPKQSWVGEIADLHIWNEPLLPSQIRHMFRCNFCYPRGTVFSWLREPLIAKDVIFSATDVCAVDIQPEPFPVPNPYS
uniref:Octin 1.1 n=1 Tax=Carcinoscorpius rotundicauda TaxID=6848 RepID=A9X251_CARRO|nr:octin 1.1 [Carcinoscorpius rotundicauda]